MTVTEKMQALLVSALAGTITSDRIKPPAKSNQGLSRPYVVHYWQDVSHEQTQDGSPENLRSWDYSVWVMADSHSEGEAIFHTLRSALVGTSDGFTVRWSGGNYDGMDAETGVHDFLLTFRVSE